jgi:hypothetical protein
MLGYLVLILFIFGPPILLFGIIQIRNKISDPNKAFKFSIASTFTLTAIYLLWESLASGNIRVDLLIIYPCLFAAYNLLLWPQFRWKSLIFSSALMGLNFWFMTQSYSWFHKHLG